MKTVKTSDIECAHCDDNPQELKDKGLRLEKCKRKECIHAVILSKKSLAILGEFVLKEIQSRSADFYDNYISYSLNKIWELKENERKIK